ncbi:MAG TPA: efflux transporter outer membrane subunit [Sphingomonadaceae bacterium]|nr:efflux transporter outer membrane subunit [Sphingomonadaceae bacterium]
MRRLAATLAALLLAGCSQQPKYVQPGMPVAPTFPTYSWSREAGPRAVEIEWRSFFKDPRLQALIERALEHNRDLRTAVLRIDEARGQYRIQRADSRPTVDAAAGAARSRSEGFGSGAVTASRFDVGASITSFELDFWGRVRALTEAARANYLATIYGQRAFQISLVADVAEAYLTERELDARIAVAQSAVASRRRALDIGQLRLEAGVTSALDYRQIETLLTQAQTELANLELQRAQTRNSLEFLVGGPVPARLPSPLPMAGQGIVENISAELPSELLTNRPDILEAEEQLRAANADVGAARAAFFPQISLTGALGLASAALNSLFTGDAFTWSAGAGAAVPIFDAGRTRGNLDVAVARRGIATAGYERATQNAFREVSDRLAARRWLVDRMTSQQRELAAQRDRAELATLRYRSGVAGFLEVLDAERELFAAEQQVLLTRREQLTNAVDLYVALGGGLEMRAITPTLAGDGLEREQSKRAERPPLSAPE